MQYLITGGGLHRSGVLRACRQLLKPGGRLVATMPLIEMNRHLLLRSNRYAKFRRRQLEHHNLWSEPKWRSALLGAGFAEVTVVPSSQVRRASRGID